MRRTFMWWVASAGVSMALAAPASGQVEIDPIFQQAYLKASNTDATDFFGRVAISGDTIVVGALGESSTATGVNGNQNINAATNSGAAYIFVRDGSGWTQQAYLKASNTEAQDKFGSSVAISGDTVVVGAPAEKSGATGVNGDQTDNSIPRSGAAYVFVRNGTSWSQQAYLKASNTQSVDFFGAVAISGDTLAVAAGNEESNATGLDGDQSDNSLTDAGAVYLFTRNGTTWSQQAYLKASNTGQIDRFGRVSMSGDTLVVGAGTEDSAAEGVNGNQASNGEFQSGAAYVFQVAAAECFLVIGDDPGSSPFSAIEHQFQTQVGPTIEDAYPVLMEAIPSFVLPGGGGGLLTKTRAVSGPGLLSLRGAPPLPDASPSWMLDGQFAVQVLMWNPMVFPGQPEQFSAGLLVSVLPDGSVLSTPYGQSVGGLEIWHEIGTNAQGQPVIRFPFSIPGL